MVDDDREPPAKTAASARARFRMGQPVHHRLFDYRGVIVDVDPGFQASEEWYETMARSRPPKNQPWYHVLVDGSATATYAAQTSLEADDAAAPITHPLVAVFFSDFTGQAYVRNDLPWPEAWD